MALPKIDMPLFEDKVPSTGMDILYRAYTVKEEKILLIAKEAKDFKQSILAAKQILNNCIKPKHEKDTFNVSAIPVFDLEYLLLKIRSKSVNNEIKFKIEDEDTAEHVTLSLDLEKVEVTKYPEHSKEIKINDDYVLVMKYPTIDAITELADSTLSEVEKSYNVMVGCLDKLISKDNVYSFDNETQESINEFLDDLDPKCITGMKDFFETMPRMRHELKYKNSAGTDKIFVIEGTDTFFL